MKNLFPVSFCFVLWMAGAFAPVSAALSLGEIEPLMELARERGDVPVIVGFELQLPKGLAKQAALLPNGRANLQRRQAIQAAQQRILDRLDAKFEASQSTNRFRHIPYLSLVADERTLRKLARDASVTSIVRDEPIPLALKDSNEAIRMPVLWDFGYTGAGAVVAVLDSGVDKNHDYFNTYSKVVAEGCFSTTYGGDGAKNLCDWENDYPDGHYSVTGPGWGVNCDPALDAGCRHGTHVAGIVAGDDGAGPNYGVARGADLVAIQVFSYIADCGGGSPCISGYMTDLINALEYVRDLRVDSGINVVAANMSLGGGLYTDEADCDSSPLKPIIDELRALNVATVIATANSSSRGGVAHPGCISSSVSVGATGDATLNYDEVASYSNIAAFVDLVGPGTGIASAWAGTLSGEGGMSGTSMATPHVAGAWAVVREIAPLMSVDEVEALFRATALSIDDNRIDGTVTDLRRIDVGRAVAILLGDLDGDDDVDRDDYLLFAATFGLSNSEGGFNVDADYDASGQIDFVDYQYFYNFYVLAR